MFILGIITGILLSGISIAITHLYKPVDALIRLTEERKPKKGSLLPFSMEEAEKKEFLEKNKNRDIPIGELFPL